MSTFFRRSTVAVAAVLLAGAACTVHKSETPSLTGPSTVGLSVAVTAVPDSINQDGASQSAIVATTFDASGQPKAGVSLRADITVNGTLQDFGQLSAKSLVTGADGKASAIYTAPAASPGSGITDVTILITAIASDAQTAIPQRVNIRLSPPGVILPVNGAPAARFVFLPGQPNANSPVGFDGSTSCASTNAAGACIAGGSIVMYAWDFNDGTTATGVFASHAFPQSRSYSVALTVTNDKGVSSTARQNIDVAGGLVPIGSFNFSPSAPGVGETVFFNAAASRAGAGHTIKSYQWSSGDGQTGAGPTPSYAYAKQGSYTVTLVVTDEAGQTSTPVTQTVPVGIGTPAPTANFTSSPAAPFVNDNVIFDASSSVVAQGQTLTSMAWNFGDGTPIVPCPADGACNGTRIIRHAYTSSGTFTVNLVVTDSAGRTGSKSSSVTIISGNPTAKLAIIKNGGNAITGDGSASTSTGGTQIVTYTFNWGDGTANTSGSGATAAHTFGGAGTYVVTLTVTDNANPARSGSVTASVTVP